MLICRRQWASCVLASRALTTNENGTRDFIPRRRVRACPDNTLVLAAKPDQDASSVLGGGEVTGGAPALVGKV